MEPLLEITAKINTDNESLSKTIENSLKPDNIDIPSGIDLNVETEKETIVITVRCSEEKILSCRETMDEILALVKSILEIIT